MARDSNLWQRSASPSETCLARQIFSQWFLRGEGPCGLENLNVPHLRSLAMEKEEKGR